MKPRLLGLVIVAIVIAYAPSLGGGWVWDDHALIPNNTAIGDWLTLISTDLFGPSGRDSHVYRPLIALSFGIEQALLPGPFLPRLSNVILLVIGALGLARWARATGATVAMACFGAGVFALHPGISEGVSWISGRQDLLPTVLLICAGASFSERRDRAAALLLFLTPFAKENFILIPLVIGLWCWASNRWPRLPILAAIAGSVSYLIIRWLLQIPFVPDAGQITPLEAIGGLTIRFVELLVRPDLADALPTLMPSALLGVFAILVVCTPLLRARTRKIWAPVCSLLLLCGPGALAAAHSLLASDRYLLTAFAGVGLLAAHIELPKHLGHLQKAMYAITILICVTLAGMTINRSADWISDRSLFDAAYSAAPENPRAAFHLAHALHRYEGRCDLAIPLYTQAREDDRRALNNLLACAVDSGDYPLALSLADEAIATDPENSHPASSAARAATAVGDLPRAQAWANEAVRRDPENGRNWVLLGNISGQAQQYAESVEAFERALAINPTDRAAIRGRETAQRLLAVEQSAKARNQPDATPENESNDDIVQE